MTVETETSRVSYTGAGTTGPFAIPFYFLANGDIRAIKVTIADGTEDELALTTDFTLTGAGDEEGGTLTLVSSLSSSFRLVIFRDPEVLQETDYPRNDPFPAKTHEEVSDRLTMISQRHANLLGRTLRQPDGDSADIDTIPAKVARASKFLAFDADGDPTAVDGSDGTSGSLAVALAASTGSSLVGHVQSGTGAVSTTVQEWLRLQKIVHGWIPTSLWAGISDGTNTTDLAAYVQAAITALGGDNSLYFPAGTYLVKSTLTVPGGLVLYGMGQRQATIKFAPTADDVLFTLTGSGSTIAQSGIVGMRLIATGETSHVKTAIQVIDGEEIELGNISIADWSDSSKSSVGFELQGRQTINVHDITVNCDQPFSLKDTPNTAAVSCDHFHFWNIYAIADSTQPVWKVDSDVWLTNCTWDGYQAWVQGTYGFFWDASTAANKSYNVNIRNARWEQSTNASGYMLYINPKTPSLGLNVENCYSDANHKGFYFRNFVSGRVAGCVYEGTGEALNVADAGVVLSMESNFFNIAAGATLSVTGFTGLFSNLDDSGSSIGDGKVRAVGFTRISDVSSGMFFDNNGPFVKTAGGTLVQQWQSSAIVPGNDNTFDLGATGNRYKVIYASGAVDTKASVKAHSSTAIPAGGTAGAGLLVSSTANFGVFFGSGAPSLSAAKGSLYLRSDGSSTSTRMYVNTDGDTTWTNVTTAA